MLRKCSKSKIKSMAFILIHEVQRSPPIVDSKGTMMMKDVYSKKYTINGHSTKPQELLIAQKSYDNTRPIQGIVMHRPNK